MHHLTKCTCFVLLGSVILKCDQVSAESGSWQVDAGKSIFVVGPASASLTGAYRISNHSDSTVSLCLGNCAKPCTNKAMPDLPGKSSIDLFISNCLRIVAPTDKNANGTYENLSPVSPP
jgi:hypothetical protein